MALQPPDPHTMKAIETATKTIIELLHEDVKLGVSELVRLVKERAIPKARENAIAFGQKLEQDITKRLSIGISPEGFERISGNLDDPDFAYLVSQATIAGARTSNKEKQRLLARAVSERLLAKPDGLVALASSLACETIPNLAPAHLSFLGILCTTLHIRPSYSPETQQHPIEELQGDYISWLEDRIERFRPFPAIRSIDLEHLQGMSCIDISRVSEKRWNEILKPRDLSTFTWPEGYLERSELISDLRKIEGLTRCILTTVGSVIGTHVHDIRLDTNPTVFAWDEAG